MNKIDISTEEKKKEVYELFNSFNKKGDIYEYFNINDNVKGVEYINKIAEEIGFDFNVYKERKKRYCLQCGKELHKGQKKFCSSSCAAKYNNKPLTEETKKKISESLKKNKNDVNKDKFCVVCGNKITNKNTKYCSIECREKNYDTPVEKKCKYCGKSFFGKKERVFCSNECCSAWETEENIIKWKNGEKTINPNYTFPSSIKNYLLNKTNYKCEECGFEGYNKKTGKTILQVHHIDGDSSNNKEENLQILCPNCHAMTENYMALNKGKSARIKRYLCL